MKRTKKIATVLLAVNLLLLTGCATQTPECIPRVVDVPVAVQSSPPAIPRPHLALEKVSGGTTAPETLRLYRESVEQLISYAQALETALDAYRPGAQK